jgi:hypothetical protein
MTVVINGTTGYSGPVGVLGDLTTTGNTILGDASTDTLNVANGNLVLNSSGNLGVGTTSPSERLHIFKSTYPIFKIESTSYNSTMGIDTGNGNLVITNTSNAGMVFSTNNTERARIDSNGYFGIGTSSPATLLSVNGSNSIARFSGASTSLSAYQTFYNNSAAQAYFGIESSSGTGIIGTGSAYGMVLSTASTNPLVLGTNGTQRMRIADTQINTYQPLSLDGGMASTRTATLGGTYNGGTWYEIGNGGNIGTGVFVLTAFVDTYNAGGNVYYMHYASTPFYFWNVPTNSGSTFVLPTMYGVGHADNGIAPPSIRLRLTGSGAGVYVDMNPPVTWSGLDSTSGKTVYFTFKRIA